VQVLTGGEPAAWPVPPLLLQKPDILLLDEPTNHPDAESVAGWSITCKNMKNRIAVTHDRISWSMTRAGFWTRPRQGIPLAVNYSSWLEQKQNRLKPRKKRKAPATKPWSANWSGS
jgi:ATPase subunit of ABC transporter with duplicated ATPase domains